MQKLQYFGHLMQRADLLEKTDDGKDWGQEKGATEDEMIRWHHQLSGHEFWANFGRWRIGKPDNLQSVGLQKVGHNLVTEQQYQSLS